MNTGIIIENLDTIITTYGVVKQNETQNQVPVPYHTSTSDFATIFYENNGNLKCNAAGPSANGKYYIIVEYTKNN